MSELERFAQRHSAETDTLRRWLIEAMVIGAAADGEIDERESDEIYRIVSNHAQFTGLGTAELRTGLERSLTAIVEDGFVPRLYALNGALRRYAHRVLAFRAAVRVAVADGRVNEEEFGLLREMQKILGIVDGDVARAFEDAQLETATPVPETIEPVETYLDCLLMMAAADGHVSDEELAAIIAFILVRQEFEGIDVDVLREYIHSNLRYFTDADNVERRLDVLIDDAPLPEQRENAYGLAISIAVVDGDIGEAERILLKRLRRALGIDEARAELVEERTLS